MAMKKRVLRANAGDSEKKTEKKSMNASRGPVKVRNVKTGELAIYTPDRLQPTLPAGWVPLNSSRTAPKATKKREQYTLQTKGDQYRILNSSRKVVAQGKLNAGESLDSSHLEAHAGMSGDANKQELEELVRRTNPDILQFYDVMTYPEMAYETGMSEEELHEDDDRWSSYGGRIIGFVKVKPEYEKAASWDGQDYGDIWENGFVGQAMGGEGSRNGHWASDLPLDIFEIEGYGDTEGDMSWQTADRDF